MEAIAELLAERDRLKAENQQLQGDNLILRGTQLAKLVEAARSTDFVFPKLPGHLVMHPVLGELFDRCSMNGYGLRVAEAMLQAATSYLAAEAAKGPAPVAAPTDEQIRDALEAEFLGEPGKRNLADDLRVARAALAADRAQAPAEAHGDEPTCFGAGDVVRIRDCALAVFHGCGQEARDVIEWYHSSLLVEVGVMASVPNVQPKGEADLYAGLIERLMTLTTRLGISYEGGVEHFGASLEDRLYAICRSTERLLDSLAAQAPAVQAGKEQAELEQEIAGLQALVIRQGDRLTEIVNIIRGQPPEGCAHSTHDAVDLVRGLQLHIEQYAMAVQHAERAHGIGASDVPVQHKEQP